MILDALQPHFNISRLYESLSERATHISYRTKALTSVFLLGVSMVIVGCSGNPKKEDNSAAGQPAANSLTPPSTLSAQERQILAEWNNLTDEEKISRMESGGNLRANFTEVDGYKLMLTDYLRISLTAINPKLNFSDIVFVNSMEEMHTHYLSMVDFLGGDRTLFSERPIDPFYSVLEGKIYFFLDAPYFETFKSERMRFPGIDTYAAGVRIILNHEAQHLLSADLQSDAIPSYLQQVTTSRGDIAIDRIQGFGMVGINAQTQQREAIGLGLDEAATEWLNRYSTEQKRMLYNNLVGQNNQFMIFFETMFLNDYNITNEDLLRIKQEEGMPGLLRHMMNYQIENGFIPDAEFIETDEDMHQLLTTNSSAQIEYAKIWEKIFTIDAMITTTKSYSTVPGNHIAKGPSTSFRFRPRVTTPLFTQQLSNLNRHQRRSLRAQLRNR